MDSSSSINRSTTTTTTTTTTSSSSNSSELFICFNTRRRLTTRISARPSILSPARDPQISLSTCRSISSRSRRLRSSGSTTRNRVRSSPMFANAAKKRGSGFDNPEPSSPKVTCIGQVRVKSKKKGIKLRSLPRRQSGEVSFRTLDQIQRQSSYNNTQFQHSRNQRWVHLPLSICESFNCLIPCKSPCVCENDKGDKKEVINEVVMVQENLEREDEMEMLPMRRTRRHVFNEIEIKDEGFDDEEEKNVNIPPKNALLLMRSRSDPVKMDKEKNVNVPPKNALLLMRCRSDPVKMEALVNRCWEPHLTKQVEDDDVEEDEEEVVEESDININVNVEKVKMVDTKDFKVSEKEENQEEEAEDGKGLVVEDEEQNEENLVNVLGDIVDEESEEDDDEIEAMEDKNEDESRVSYSNASFSLQSDDDISESDDNQELAALELDTVDFIAQKMTQVKILEEKMTHEEEIQENNVKEDIITKTEETEYHAKAIVESETELKKEERESSKLPDCLLLMMCEPKLSMEVSKETWVCNKDVVEEEEGRVAHLPVAKSSCNFPASMAAMIEQKLLNAAAYEPFVLTRCKSAPIGTAGAIQLAPDGWFWKNGGLEKHQRGGFRVGAAELVRFQLSR